MSIKISNLTIKVNKKSLTLTINEAKELFDELNQVFGPRYNYTTWPYSTGITYATNTATGSVLTSDGSGNATFTSGSNALGNGTITSTDTSNLLTLKTNT